MISPHRNSIMPLKHDFSKKSYSAYLGNYTNRDRKAGQIYGQRKLFRQAQPTIPNTEYFGKQPNA